MAFSRWCTNVRGLAQEEPCLIAQTTLFFREDTSSTAAVGTEVSCVPGRGGMTLEKSLLGSLPAEVGGLPFLNAWVREGDRYGRQVRLPCHRFPPPGNRTSCGCRSFQARGEEPDHIIGLGEARPGEAAELGEDPTGGPDWGP